MTPQKIVVLGAGITGLWQAYILSQRGHDVTLVEQGNTAFNRAASAVAGAMLAPWCEGEAAEPAIQELGLRSIQLWKEVFGGVKQNGTLVIAQPRDRNELKRFAAMTQNFKTVDEAAISQLEPVLEGRYRTGLYYPEEAHMQPVEAMNQMVQLLMAGGAKIIWNCRDIGDLPNHDLLLDCRGMAAKDELKTLRGVRGELLVVQSEEISLSRPVRLLHPRFPLYVVPWSGNRFMIGATVLESEENGAVTVRSALELLGMAYALHPSFGEAEILSFRANVRPAFPDNIPKIIRQEKRLYVNGIFRHGFLNAPALAVMVADYLETGRHPGEMYKDVFVEDNGQW